jgi:hypothetical protein
LPTGYSTRLNHFLVLRDSAGEQARYPQEIGGGSGEHFRAENYDRVSARRRRRLPKRNGVSRGAFSRDRQVHMEGGHHL